MKPFGGERWGFVVASSKNGRIVVLRRFVGNERPTFAHHGESSVPAEMTLFDLEAGTERSIADLIDVDRARRRLLVLDGKPSLVDSEDGRWLPLDDATSESDENTCLQPRQATFSPSGARVGWITKKGTLVVLDLASNERATFTAKGRLWRGWPDDDGSVVLGEVPSNTKDWPTQMTSCACRWCNRFALSSSTGGWRGAFDLTRVSKDGKRSSADDTPDGSGAMNGPDSRGRELRAASSEENLERGPWRWSDKTVD